MELKQQISPVKYKVISASKVCMSFETYKALYLAGDYEELGERCLTPWDCSVCRGYEKRLKL